MLSAPPQSPAPLGVSGRLAALFVGSKLTPLIIIASLLLGLFAIVLTPREEEPQIVVPMADVWLSFPGASAKVVEEQLTKPIERKLSEIKTVEYVYSISRPGGALIIVRFYVGEPMEQSLVDLYDKLMSNQDLLPPGAQPFQVKPRDVNDVPIVTLTLSSERYTDFQLRQLGDQVLEDAKKVPGTAAGFVVGGRGRELRVQIDPSRLKAYGLTPLRVAGVIQGENLALPTGRFESRNESFLVETGRFIRSKEDLEGVVVGVNEQRPVYLRQVAEVTDGPTEATSYVWHGEGPGGAHETLHVKGETNTPASHLLPFTSHENQAVTVAIAKQAGTNAVTIAQGVIRKVEELKGTRIPDEVRVTVTRDYGETADEKPTSCCGIS
jgi:multidrug efflux pump subunit AcrB